MNRLTVLYDGLVIGEVQVTERSPRKVFGRFIPGPAFARHRALFDEAERWAGRLDELPSNEPMDYLAWDRWVAAIELIAEHVELPGLPAGIEELAVYRALEVEITLTGAPE